MKSKVEEHYSSTGRLADIIAIQLRAAGKDLAKLTAADLAPVDEFHIRGRKATVELGAKMELGPGSRVLDVGSGLGGPARTLAELYQCHVTGIDLTSDFCAAANEMSRWVGLSDRVTFRQADATALQLDAGSFDAAMTIHVAMNIAAKDAVYAGVHRALRPGRVFAVYDVLKGEGGEVHFPVPWAREPSISHLATPDEMRRLLEGTGFTIVSEIDSTEESGTWFKEIAARMAAPDGRPMSFRAFLGDDYAQMAANQVRNLAERRIRTVTYIARS